MQKKTKLIFDRGNCDLIVLCHSFIAFYGIFKFKDILTRGYELGWDVIKIEPSNLWVGSAKSPKSPNQTHFSPKMFVAMVILVRNNLKTPF